MAARRPTRKITRPEPTQVWAETLSGAHIGRIIRFRTHDNLRDIASVITCELRQVYHVQGETHLTVGTGASREYNLQFNSPVILDPMTDYSDVPIMLGVDPEPLQIPGEIE